MFYIYLNSELDFDFGDEAGKLQNKNSSNQLEGENLNIINLLDKNAMNYKLTRSKKKQTNIKPNDVSIDKLYLKSFRFLSKIMFFHLVFTLIVIILTLILK